MHGGLARGVRPPAHDRNRQSASTISATTRPSPRGSRRSPACSTSSWWRVEAAGLEHVPSPAACCWSATTPGGFFPYDGLMIAEALARASSGRRTAGAAAGRGLRLSDAVSRSGCWRAPASSARRRRTPGGCSPASRPSSRFPRGPRVSASTIATATACSASRAAASCRWRSRPGRRSRAGRGRRCARRSIPCWRAGNGWRAVSTCRTSR